MRWSAYAFQALFVLANLANERIDAFIERIVHIFRPLLRTEYHTVVDNGYLNCLTLTSRQWR